MAHNITNLCLATSQVSVCLHLALMVVVVSCLLPVQDQDQDSLLVKRQNDNHSPGPVIRELVPSSHQKVNLVTQSSASEKGVSIPEK